jgi:plasmid maintenance system killer protein
MCRVRLIKEVAERKREIEEELSKGNRRDEREYKLLLKGIEKLKIDYRSGAHVSKKKHRKPFEHYQKKHGIENLWKLNVSQDWRLVYTVVSKGVEIVSFILDIMDHKRYDKTFGYSTS